MTAAPLARSTGMRRALLLSIAGLLLLAGDARACSCVGAAAVLPDAERVFVGTVVERGGSGDEAVYTFAVEQVIRGDVPGRIDLRAGTQEASCGLDLPVGRRVAVMLTQPGDQVNLCQVADPAEVGASPPAPALLRQFLGACATIARWAGWRSGAW